MEVLDVAQAPDTSDEELLMRVQCCRVDDDAADPQVCERSLVDVILLVERDADLVNDPVTPALLDL